MLKRIVIVLVFLGLLFFIALQTHQLPLSFYVLLPMLMLPTLYLIDNSEKKLLVFAASIFLVFVAIEGYLLKSFYVLGLCMVMGASLLVFYFYRKRWVGLVCEETDLKHFAIQDLQQLQAKYNSRMESLRHLENQVGSLIDLYEIARDFNECLNLASVARIIHKKVLPELEFHRLALVVRKLVNDVPTKTLSFVITEAECESQEIPADESKNENLYLLEQQLVEDAQGMVRDHKRWIFPLLMEKKTKSFAVVEAANEDDLAKFEVMMAYLSLQIKKVELYQEVKELSIRDGLTDVFVRRHFMERFEEELKRSEKFNLPMGILMLDIDLFKRYNDEHGHLAGDAALRKVSTLLTENLRKLDIVGRYGGEEFVIILPESTREGARDVAERIRSSIARSHFMLFKERTRVTVSVGGAFFPTDIDREKVKGTEALAFDLIQMADKALYRAKEEGRNQVVFHDEL